MADPDFIEVYPDALPRETCAQIVAAFEASGAAVPGRVGGGVLPELKDSRDIQITGNEAWREAENALNRAVFTGLLAYLRTYRYALIAPLMLQVRGADGKLRRIAAEVDGAVLGAGGLFLAGRYEALEGIDTMPSLVAVLDTNFWLATHVTTITMGYAAGLLASAFAHVYIFGRLIAGERFPKARAKSLVQMIYGVVCFALIFSVVGTILGGVWANESWGRFWGWDPKENGALMIVIWTAVMLHARWGGMVKARGFMVLAVFGNIVTSWSWFGTNMLGVGLHSYGFMDAAFYALISFVGSQLLFMAIGLIPLEKWRSFRGQAGTA